MEIRNLREPDIEELEKKVRELPRENPDIRTRLFNIPEDSQDEVKERLARVENKLDVLTRKIELIFGDNFLRDGKFEKIPIL